MSTLSLTSTTTLKASREDLFSGRTGGTNTARTENIVKEDTDLNTSIKTILLALPFINVDSHTKTSSKEAYAVSSKSGDIPLKIKLFPTDNTTKNFGTSKKTGTDAGKYHTLYARNAGGLRFDLRGVDTSNSSFTF